MEIGHYESRYKPRTTIRAQAIADFMMEFTSSVRHEGKPEAPVDESSPYPSPLWFLSVDGSSNEHGCNAGLVLTSPLPKCVKVKYVIQLGFKASKNESEYEVFLVDLKLVVAIGAKRLHIHNDYQLVVKQVKE